MTVLTDLPKPEFVCARCSIIPLMAFFILLAPHRGKIKHFSLELVLAEVWGLSIHKRNRKTQIKASVMSFGNTEKN